jgi:hypothetical protein
MDLLLLRENAFIRFDKAQIGFVFLHVAIRGRSANIQPAFGPQ